MVSILPRQLGKVLINPLGLSVEGNRTEKTHTTHAAGHCQKAETCRKNNVIETQHPENNSDWTSCLGRGSRVHGCALLRGTGRKCRISRYDRNSVLLVVHSEACLIILDCGVRFVYPYTLVNRSKCSTCFNIPIKKWHFRKYTCEFALIWLIYWQV